MRELNQSFRTSLVFTEVRFTEEAVKQCSGGESGPLRDDAGLFDEIFLSIGVDEERNRSIGNFIIMRIDAGYFLQLKGPKGSFALHSRTAENAITVRLIDGFLFMHNEDMRIMC